MERGNNQLSRRAFLGSLGAGIGTLAILSPKTLFSQDNLQSTNSETNKNSFTNEERILLAIPHRYTPKKGTWGSVKFTPEVDDEDLRNAFWYAKKKQLRLAQQYESIISSSDEDRNYIISNYILPTFPEAITDARKKIENKLETIVNPLWLGTGWNEGGKTDRPQVKSIACGYFADRVMNALGFKTYTEKRGIKLGQQIYADIMKTFVEKDLWKDYRNLNMNKFVSKMESLSQGWYLIGLDTHGGFIHIGKDKIEFIHSTKLGPEAVVCQDARTSPSLGCSKIKTMCPLFNDDMIKKWINNSPYEISTGGFFS